MEGDGAMIEIIKMGFAIGIGIVAALFIMSIGMAFMMLVWKIVSWPAVKVYDWLEKIESDKVWKNDPIFSRFKR